MNQRKGQATAQDTQQRPALHREQVAGTLSDESSLVSHQGVVQETQHIMSLLSQFFPIIYTIIARSFETAASTYIDSCQRSLVEMTDLQRHCHVPDRYRHHQDVVNNNNGGSNSSSSSSNTRLQTRCDPYNNDDDTTLERHTLPCEFSLKNYDGSADHPLTARRPILRPPGPPPDTSPSHHSTYLCTFCWRPHRAAITPSRVVGRGARLACEMCYNSLLDLAVC